MAGRRVDRASLGARVLYGLRIAAFLLFVCFACVSFFGCEESVDKDAWVMPAPEELDGGYALQLSDYQRAHLSSASYTIIRQVQLGYYSVMADIPIEPDESGKLSIPSDLNVVMVFTDSEGEGMLIRAACEEKDATSMTFRTSRLRLAASTSFGVAGLPSAYERMETKFRFDGGAKTATKIEMTRAFDRYPLGINVSEEQLALYRAISYAWGQSSYKIRAADGTMAPVSEWEPAGYSMASAWWFEDGFEARLVPISEVEGAFSIQVTVLDDKGVAHGSDITELEVSHEEEAGGIEVATERGTMTFSCADGRATLKGYEGEDERVTVPKSVEGLPVVEIGDRAFYNNKYIREVEIPETVERIGSEAFRSSSLRRFEVPKGLKKLGYAAFADAESFIEFSQKSSNGTTSVHDGVLYTADKKTLLAFPMARTGSFTVPNGVETIGFASFLDAKVSTVKMCASLREIEPCAFCGCTNLTSVDLPESLERIGSAAFDESLSAMFDMDRSQAEVKSIRIGKNVSYIGRDAFVGLALESIEVDEENPWYSSAGGFLLSADGALLEAPAGIRGAIEIPEGVTSLSYGWLPYFDGERTSGPSRKIDMFLPESLTSIDELALPTMSIDDGFALSSTEEEYAVVFHVAEGSWAENYAIDNGITYDSLRSARDLLFTEEVLSNDYGTMTFRVFDDHAALVGLQANDVGHIEIPDKVKGVPVTVIGLDEHDQVYGTVKTVILPKTLERIEGRLLSSLSEVRAFELEDGNVHCSIREGAIYSADGKKLIVYPSNRGDSYTVPDGTVEIGDYAFYDASLSALELPEGLERIGRYAFGSAGQLTSVNLPSTLKSIGEGAFYFTALERVQLNNGLEEIGKQAFTHIGGYEGLSIPDSVKTIGYEAFDPSLYGDFASIGERQLHIGAGLERVEGGAFVDLDIDGFDVAVENESFKEDGPFLLSKDGRTLYACASAVSGEVRVPDGVEMVEGGAFDGAKMVTDIYLPESLLFINSTAFERVNGGYGFTLHCPPGSEAARIAKADDIPYVEE